MQLSKEQREFVSDTLDQLQAERQVMAQIWERQHPVIQAFDAATKCIRMLRDVSAAGDEQIVENDDLEDSKSRDAVLFLRYHWKDWPACSMCGKKAVWHWKFDECSSLDLCDDCDTRCRAARKQAIKEGYLKEVEEIFYIQ